MSIVCNTFRAIQIKSEILVHKLQWKTKPNLGWPCRSVRCQLIIAFSFYYSTTWNKSAFLTLCIKWEFSVHKSDWTEKQSKGENADQLICAQLFIEVLLQRHHWLEQNCASQAQKHKWRRHTGWIFNAVHQCLQVIWAAPLLWISRCLNGSYNSCLWRPNFLAISSITLQRGWKSPVLCSLLHWREI